MKRILWAGAIALVAGGQALAADLPPPVAPRAPATYVPTTVPVYNWSGIYIGANGGYAFGTSSWNNAAAGLTTGNFNTNGGLAGGTVGGNVQWGAAVRGRAGWAIDRVLLYGTGGAAFAPVQAGFNGGPFQSSTQVGWTAGAGVEF